MLRRNLPRANDALVEFYLKAVWGTRDLQMLKVFFFKPFSSQNKGTFNNKGTQARNKRKCSFFSVCLLLC